MLTSLNAGQAGLAGRRRRRFLAVTRPGWLARPRSQAALLAGFCGRTCPTGCCHGSRRSPRDAGQYDQQRFFSCSWSSLPAHSPGLWDVPVAEFFPAWSSAFWRQTTLSRSAQNPESVKACPVALSGLWMAAKQRESCCFSETFALFVGTDVDEYLIMV